MDLLSFSGFFTNISHSDFFFRADYLAFLHHGIKFIRFVSICLLRGAPTLPLRLKLVSDFDFIRDLAAKEISSLLLGVEVVPLRVFIFVFVVRRIVRCRTRPVLVVSLVAILVLVAAPVVLWASLPILLVVALLVLVSLVRLLQGYIWLGLRRLDTLGHKATRC